MRAFVPAYELVAPATLAVALDLLAGGWTPMAGGTDLMVQFEAGKLRSMRLVGLWKLAELRGIVETPEFIALGALTTYTDVRRSAVLAREFPLLVEAARLTGGVQTQNRGTLAGNIMNASPAADSPPVLMVYDAQLELVSAGGTRRVPYHGFHTGYKQTGLASNELLRSIRLPRPAPGARHYYRKVGTRAAQAISKVVFAGVAWMDGGVVRDIRIAVGSVAPAVLRCLEAETGLRGRPLDPGVVARARDTLAGEIAPIDDFRSTARYRRQVAGNLLEEFLDSLLSQRRFHR